MNFFIRFVVLSLFRRNLFYGGRYTDTYGDEKTNVWYGLQMGGGSKSNPLALLIERKKDGHHEV